MTTTKDKPAAAAIKDLLNQSPDALREIVHAVMQEMSRRHGMPCSGSAGLRRLPAISARSGSPRNSGCGSRAVLNDVASLNEYEAHLSGKVQFLLDAVLGYITIEQNDLFKVLTIASVVGIPPTLIAGLYGMNFKFMPELDWTWGYPFGLALILLGSSNREPFCK